MDSKGDKIHSNSISGQMQTRDVKISIGEVVLEGALSIPVGAEGIVLFAHGSGSSHHSPRNQFVAQSLYEAGMGTLLFG